MKKLLIIAPLYIILNSCNHNSTAKLPTELSENEQFAHLTQLESQIKSLSTNIDSLQKVKSLSADLFEKSQNFLSVYDTSAYQKKVLEFVINSAEGLGKFNEAIFAINQRIAIEENSDIKIELMMEKAFLFENHLHQIDSAKLAYQAIINLDSNHTFAKDAQFILNNLEQNISDEELIKMFEEKNTL